MRPGAAEDTREKHARGSDKPVAHNERRRRRRRRRRVAAIVEKEYHRYRLQPMPLDHNRSLLIAAG